MNLKILKSYLIRNLVNKLIKNFKLTTNILILYIYKKNENIYFYINYLNFNNSIIKN